MQHPESDQEVMRTALYERAQRKFGKARADELRSEIEKIAADLHKIYSHPLRLEDEP